MAGTFITRSNQSFAFDTTLSVAYRHPALVTEHPIEAGADISDHRQKQMMNFTITGRVSATPLITENQIGPEPANEYERMIQAKEFFETNEDQLMTWVGPKMGVVSNVVIKSFAYDETKMGHLDFTVECIVVRFGQFALTEVPPIRIRKNGAKPKPNPPKDAATKAVPRTWLAQMADAFSNGEGVLSPVSAITSAPF